MNNVRLIWFIVGSYQAIEYGFVDMKTVFGDGTHQKANANKNKNKDVEV